MKPAPLVIPANTARVVEIVHDAGKRFANVVLRDGTPKTVRQP